MKLEKALSAFAEERLLLGVLERTVYADNEIISRILYLTKKNYKRVTRRDAKLIRLAIFKYPVYARNHKELEGLKGEDIILKADELNLQRISAETIKRYLRLINLFFNWLVDEGVVDNNPFHGLKPKRDLSQQCRKRNKFDESHLKIIFSDPIFHTKDEVDSFKYWTPLLSLCNGLRQTEAAQLESYDVELVDGVWCIHVRKNSERKHVKSARSIRTIPVSEYLINLGFIEFAMSKRGHLFPELPYGRNGFGTRVSKWMSYRKRRWGFSRGFDFYSFRHTFINKLKQKGCNESVVAEIAGHAHDGITFSVYGKEYELKTKKEVVDLFNSEVISNLPRLY